MNCLITPCQHAPSSSFSTRKMMPQQYTQTPNRERVRHVSELLLHLTDGEKVQVLGARLRTLVYSKLRAERSENHDYTLTNKNWRVPLLPLPIKASGPCRAMPNPMAEHHSHTVWSLHLKFNPSSRWQALKYFIAAIMPPLSSYLWAKFPLVLQLENNMPEWSHLNKIPSSLIEAGNPICNHQCKH